MRGSRTRSFGTRSGVAAATVPPYSTQRRRDIAGLLRGRSASFVEARWQQILRVGDLPVLTLFCANERTRVAAAHRRYKIVFDLWDVFERFRLVLRQIVPDLAHRCDRFLIHLARRLRAGTVSFDVFAAVDPRKRFCYLTAVRVLHTYKQQSSRRHGLIFAHSARLCRSVADDLSKTSFQLLP